MASYRLISWTSFVLFAIGIVLVVLVVLAPTLAPTGLVLSEAAVWAIAVLALLSAVLGLVAFRSAPGKIAAIGGVLLLLAALILIPTSATVSG